MASWKVITDEQILDSVKTTSNYKQALEKLGFVAKGYHPYETLKIKMLQLGLTKKDFYCYDGNIPWAKGKFGSDNKTYIPVSKYLRLYSDVEYPPNLVTLKNKLVREGIKENKCECCGLETWLGLPVSFHLHHVDGNRRNNNIENILVLCPLCHSQTENYAGRKKGNKTKTAPKVVKIKTVVICEHCKRSFIQTKEHQKYCSSDCYHKGSFGGDRKTTRKFDVPIDDFRKLLVEKSMEEIGRMFGVSGNAIKKRAIKLGLL